MGEVNVEMPEKRRRITHADMYKMARELEEGKLSRRPILGWSFASQHCWRVENSDGTPNGFVVCRRCNFFFRDNYFKRIKDHVLNLHLRGVNMTVTSPSATAHTFPDVDSQGDAVELDLASFNIENCLEEDCLLVDLTSEDMNANDILGLVQPTDSAMPSTSAANVASLPIAIRNPPTVRLPNFKCHQNGDVDELLLQVMREENVPTSFLENEYFKEFVAKLNKTYKMPTVRKISDPRMESGPINFPYILAPPVSTTSFNPSFRVVQRRQPSILKMTGRPLSASVSVSNHRNPTTAVSAALSHQPMVVTLSEDPEPVSILQPAKSLASSSKNTSKRTRTSATFCPSASAPSAISLQSVIHDTPPSSDVDGGSKTHHNTSTKYNPAMLTAAAVRQKSHMRKALERAECVMLTAKSYNLSTADKRVYGQLLCVFAFTPQPYVVGLYKQLKRQDINYMATEKHLQLFVNNLISDVGRSRIFALRMDSSGLSSEFAMLLMEKCSWLIVDADDGKGAEIPFISSLLLPMMSPLSTPSFNDAAMKMLAEKFAKQPKFRDTMLMVDWAHWTARTGTFSPANRSYAWTQETLKQMDTFTWWNGFYSDTTLARLYSAINLIDSVTAKIRNNWRLIEQVIHNESKSLDPEELMKVIFVRFNRRDNMERQIVFSPIE